MPNNVRAEDDAISNVRASWRPESQPSAHPAARDTFDSAPVGAAAAYRGYTSEELDIHANEQLRSSSPANSNARVRQPRQPLRANTSRVQFQRTARGLASRTPESPAAPETGEPSAT